MSSSTASWEPPYYLKDWALMAKKTHLSIQEIYQYQHMDSAQIGAVFFQLGVQKGANLFHMMLKSFQIASRVANAAWGVYEKMNPTNVSHELASSEAMKKLQQALHDYSPDNFHPHLGDLEFAADCFEQFYNEVAELKTKEEVEERLFQWTAQLREKIATRAEGITKLTVQEVVSNAKRNPVSAPDEE
jgi:uncharacterized protein YdcH (DUF465 family)